MKTIIKTTQVAIIGVIIIVLASCSKNFLDTVPDTTISDLTAFSTPKRIEAQVNALYAGLKSANMYGGRYLIFNELRGDEFLIGKPDPGQASNIWAHTIGSGSGEIINMWSSGYSTINRVNTFLDGLEKNKTIISDALYTQYVAEAKFVRATSYFALLQMYAKPYNLDKGASPGLPLRLQAEKTNSNNDLARSTVAAVYDVILKDLDEAELSLPLTYGNAYTNATKAHRNAAIAFKTRVYLHKGDYAKVIAESKKIVDLGTMASTSGVIFGLEPTYPALFTGSYTGREAVFYMPFSSADAGSLITFYFRAPPAAGSEYYLNPSGILANPALNSASDKRSTMIVSSTGLRWLNKYTTPNPNTDYVPVLRYVEVLLNYAEAAARTGALADAATLLNAVRKRSDPTYSFSATDLASQTSLVNLIITERRIELIGEGFRVPDVQRLVLPIPGKAAPSGIAPTLDPSSTLYIWPISSEELGTNKLMTPN